MNIALVTDSTADLPQDLIDLYHIEVVPNILILDGKQVEDGIGISREEFYERLPSMKSFPTTSTASIGTYQRTYEKLLHNGADTVISIHVSKNLSGIFNAASSAAEIVSERIIVIDSEQLTLGLGFQVLAAAEAIAHGATLDNILSVIEDVRGRVVVIAMLDTLEYLARSGRVSWARARIGNLLRIKPFVKVQMGEVIRLGDVRTRKNGINRLRTILQELGQLERLAFLHTNAQADIYQIYDDIKNDLPEPRMEVYVTTVIGAHVGPNGIGFAAVVK